MVDKSVADGLLIQYLKKEHRVNWDAFVEEVRIDIFKSIPPTLEVISKSFNKGVLSHSVDVDHLRDYINNHTHNLSIHSVLHFYGIEMLSNKKLQYIYTKDSNEITPNKEEGPIDPKAVAGSEKLSFHEMPILTLASIAKPFADGAKKYGFKNFYDFESYVSVYLSALKRHLMLFEAGQDNTSDSGVHHVDSMIAGLMVMREKMLVGKLVDDRKILDNKDIETLEELLNNE